MEETLSSAAAVSGVRVGAGDFRFTRMGAGL